MSNPRTAFARALDQLVNKKNPDGTLRYTAKDVHALRSILLLEIVRRNETEQLSEASQVELGLTLSLIGITPHTSPDLVTPLVQKYFRGLGINLQILVEWNELVGLLGKQKDRVEAVEDTQKAYDKLVENDPAKAPQLGEAAPEDSEQAQTLTLNMGGKVRI